VCAYVLETIVAVVFLISEVIKFDDPLHKTVAMSENHDNFTVTRWWESSSWMGDVEYELRF
jgi:hypothetical protein